MQEVHLACILLLTGFLFSSLKLASLTLLLLFLMEMEEVSIVDSCYLQYKAHRRKFSRKSSAPKKYPAERSHVVMDVLTKCNVPVVKIEGHEADDVVATLAGQVLQNGHKVVIASPDKDFKQLISEDVQIVLPIAELNRWSFYTLKHYISQYNCDPCSDLSLRCIMGDEVDGVPGIQNVAPGFGRKTALKLLKKHGSLQNLLDAAAVRTVGKQYAQDALTNHSDYLRRNYEILALRRWFVPFIYP
ncbi:hypothetical protein H0E87_022648 [Populus deltoides]|uniref:5'-3' exonuclease domain-containing protein n=1 Tax=Populus deltoides TaxID=3696 RepID=A0A8T2XB09_POPDE|nr:hypothetical protein H0E87_022648 [Populus deltoides]